LARCTARTTTSATAAGSRTGAARAGSSGASTCTARACTAVGASTCTAACAASTAGPPASPAAAEGRDEAHEGEVIRDPRLILARGAVDAAGDSTVFVGVLSDKLAKNVGPDARVGGIDRGHRAGSQHVPGAPGV